ncbi:MAG: hypothetical protein P1V97_18810 [Planctomycetota bacterium]|nr:hypothetical protein [Planctomycetota bacterium]
MRKNTIQCKHCHESFETGLAPGKMAKCKHCGEKCQVNFQSEVGEETVFNCKNCSAEIRTKTPAGKKVKCAGCEEKVRVPLKEAPVALRSLECAGCQEPYETTAKPGQEVRCPACSQPQRIPLEPQLTTFKRAPESEESLAARSVVSRRCPDCDAKVPGLVTLCPDCGVDIDEAIKKERYGHTNPNLMAHDAGPVSYLDKIMEGRFGMIGSAAIAVLGLGVCAKSVGDGFIIPKFLIIGIIVFLGGFTGFCMSLQRRFRRD